MLQLGKKQNYGQHNKTMARELFVSPIFDNQTPAPVVQRVIVHSDGGYVIPVTAVPWDNVVRSIRHISGTGA